MEDPGLGFDPENMSDDIDFASPVTSAAGPTIRVIPCGLVGSAGGKPTHLRLTLVILPEEEAGLEDWPAYIESLLAKNPLKVWVGAGKDALQASAAAKGYSVQPLDGIAPDTSKSRSRLWSELLFPKIKHQYNKDLDTVASLVAGEAAVETDALTWAGRLIETQSRPRLNAFRVQRAGPGVVTFGASGTISTVSAGLGQLELVMKAVAELDHARGLRRAADLIVRRSRQDGRVTAQSQSLADGLRRIVDVHIPPSETLLGLTNLLRFKPSPQHPTLSAAGASDDDARFEHAKKMIGAFGLAAATTRREKRMKQRIGFDRELPSGAIEDQISDDLEKAVKVVWNYSASLGQRSRNPTAHTASVGGPDDWAATTVGILQNALNAGASAATGSLSSDPANLIARYLLAHRPEPGFKHEAHLQNVDLTAISFHVMARSLQDVETRRVFGLLAYPAVARVLRLVQDIEIPLSDELKQQIGADATNAPIFWAAASFGGTDASVARLWTPCRIDGQACIALSRGEVASAADVGPHWRGMANLGEKVGGLPRYTITSRHIMAAVEQLINKARGTEAAARSSGSVAARGDATHRTGGITLIDNSREAALHDEITNADAQVASQQSGVATPIYVEDLSVGYRIDVSVKARNQVGYAETWRSLMGREITLKPVRDPRGPIDVEDLIAGVLNACAPRGVDGRRDAVSFRRALDEASIRPATRQIRTTDNPTPGSEIDLGQLAPQEGIFQWHGDPMGLACGTDALSPRASDDSGALDTRTDLVIPVTFSPLRGPVARPPRLEFKRQYAFRARHAMLGGGGISPDQADDVMQRLPGELRSADHVHLRHERVSAPHVAMLDATRRNGPGETLDTMVIRSVDTRGGKDVSRRIVWAAGVPMADAAAHPDPERPGKRMLDAALLAGKRPLGGLLNVMIDPITGGLPTDRGKGPVFPMPGMAQDEKGGEGVFAVRATSADDLKARRAHYYPDPAVSAIMIEIDPHSATQASTRKSIDLYDPNYRQDVDDRLYPRGWRRCVYPFAMPVLIETVSDSDPQMSRDCVEPRFADGAGEVGTLDKNGRFTPLKANRTPPTGSVTVRRVRILLPPGCDAKLACWSVVPADRRALFADYSAAAATIRRSLATVEPSVASAGAFDRALEDVALPQLAEITEMSLVHAVKRPDAPVLPPDSPALQRLNYSTKEWSDYGGAPPEPTDQREWAPRHLAVANAWMSGQLLIDGPDTSEVSLNIAWRQADDIPGKAIVVDSQGIPQFPLSSPTIVKVPVERGPSPGRTVEIDILRDGDKSRNVVLPLPDSRAYHLLITPAAKSSFIRYFDDGKIEGRFERTGPSRSIWALATRRPDSMGAIEILPVFVWEEIGDDTVTRTMTVRLSWRRARQLAGVATTIQDTTQLWYSSGWGERLALIFDRGQPLGGAERYTTQWGADAIRDSRMRPDWATPIEHFAPVRGERQIKCNQWLPFPGTSDDAEQPPPAAKFAASVDLLTIDPRYDPTVDAWYVDVRVDAPTMANMWLRLGLARYQEQALSDPDDPRRDMHVSRPTTVQFELKPKRTVTARALPRPSGSKTWPVLIEVRGPLGSVNGLPRGDDGRVIAMPVQPIGTFFTVEVRKHRAPLFDFGDSYNETIYRANTDPSATPDGDLLCRMIVDLPERPWGGKHSVLVTERDRMLSANEDAGIMIEDSGPTFMAEVQIRRPRK